MYLVSGRCVEVTYYKAGPGVKVKVHNATKQLNTTSLFTDVLFWSQNIECQGNKLSLKR